MSEWEKPETWEHATKAMESFVAATAVVSTGLAKLKKALARKKRQKRDIAKEVDELKSNLERLINVLTHQLDAYTHIQLKFISSVHTILDRLIEHEKKTKALAEVFAKFTTGAAEAIKSTSTAVAGQAQRISKLETPPMARISTRAKRKRPP
jgi:hypothetical protein